MAMRCQIHTEPDVASGWAPRVAGRVRGHTRWAAARLAEYYAAVIPAGWPVNNVFFIF